MPNNANSEYRAAGCAPPLGYRIAGNRQAVKGGEVVAVLEAMKMENEIMAPHDATVVQVLAGVGDKVDTGAPLIVLG